MSRYGLSSTERVKRLKEHEEAIIEAERIEAIMGKFEIPSESPNQAKLYNERYITVERFYERVFIEATLTLTTIPSPGDQLEIKTLYSLYLEFLRDTYRVTPPTSIFQFSYLLTELKLPIVRNFPDEPLLSDRKLILPEDRRKDPCNVLEETINKFTAKRVAQTRRESE